VGRDAQQEVDSTMLLLHQYKFSMWQHIVHETLQFALGAVSTQSARALTNEVAANDEFYEKQQKCLAKRGQRRKAEKCHF